MDRAYDDDSAGDDGDYYEEERELRRRRLLDGQDDYVYKAGYGGGHITLDYEREPPSKRGKDIPEPPAPKGRVCGAPECDTVLSVYNTESTCSVHKRPHRYGVLHQSGSAVRLPNDLTLIDRR
jgi:hypothetical protein